MAGTTEMGRKVYKCWRLSVKRQNGRVLTAKNQGCQQEALMDYTGTDIKEIKTMHACNSTMRAKALDLTYNHSCDQNFDYKLLWL